MRRVFFYSNVLPDGRVVDETSDPMSLFPSHSLLLLLLIFCPMYTSGSTPINPLYEICDNGVPDVVVTLANGTPCLLKGAYFYEIDVQKEKASIPFVIRRRWPGLPAHLDLAFTLTDVSWSEVNDMTVFAKGKVYYVYKNFEFQLNGSAKYWFGVEEDKSPNEEFYDQVIYQKKDAVVSFRSKRMFDLFETAMLFDDIHRPEKVQVYRLTQSLHPSVRSILDSSHSFYFIPSIGETFHLYWIQDTRSEGLFCFLSSFKSPCSPKKVTSMFNCPVELQAVRKKHFLGSVTTRYHIATEDFILCVLGIAISALVILICMHLPLFPKYRAVRSILEDLTSVEEEEEE